MMDCNVTTNFLAELKRMHEANKECTTCPLGTRNNGEGCTCDKFLRMCGEKALKIVQEWSDQHPVKTRLSVFLETFPNAVMKSKGDLPLSCARLIFGFDENECEKKSCAECWNTPIEQEVQP